MLKINIPEQTEKKPLTFPVLAQLKSNSKIIVLFANNTHGLCLSDTYKGTSDRTNKFVEWAKLNSGEWEIVEGTLEFTK